MNTPEQPKFRISADFIGPIFSLDGELTKRAQNLIFARNGTGKSFLSRAFRYLDLQGQGKEIEKAAFYLVSEEAQDGKGNFQFARGPSVLGQLALSQSDCAVLNPGDTIFHVFSDDFVQEELREHRYELDGKIENEISVGSENIELKSAQTALHKVMLDVQQAQSELSKNFFASKESELKGKAGINAALGDYKALTLENALAQRVEKPNKPNPTLKDIVVDLDRLKSIPSDINYPQNVEHLKLDDVVFDDLGSLLSKLTSPSTVAEQVKGEIEAHNEFFKTGVGLVEEGHLTSCPFCKQSIQHADPKRVIDEYVTYFGQEEERHKSELRHFGRILNSKTDALNELENAIGRQRSKFDELKGYLPSFKDEVVRDCTNEIDRFRVALKRALQRVEDKGRDLAVEQTLEPAELHSSHNALVATMEANWGKVEALTKAIGKADDERRLQQRKACGAFADEFVLYHWDEIQGLITLNEDSRKRAEEVRRLERSGPTTNARDRVANTFELLLKEFFGDKYVFSRDDFTLKRGTYTMGRGTQRTMSDGEKSAMAFCYFVANIHQKVKANEDYQKLFLVFDDPVTSMSYDFVFTIAQTLKNLSISRDGEVSTNPSVIDGNKNARPNLLILTHSSYFFNIAQSNKVVEKEAAFSLHQSGDKHQLSRMDRYIAPFQQQLTDIYNVAANGADPDHTTGNSIRALLEAVGRFCRPDKAESLTTFITYLAGLGDLNIKSVMINNLSHGTYADETPTPEDLKLACQETIRVFEKFAPGQIELVR